MLSFIILTIFISKLEVYRKVRNSRLKKQNQKNMIIFFTIYIILSIIINLYLCYKVIQFNTTVLEKIMYIITCGSFLALGFIISIVEFYEFKTGKTVKIAGIPVLNTGGKSDKGGFSSGGFSGGGGSSRRPEESQVAFETIGTNGSSSQLKKYPIIYNFRA